MEEEEVEVKNDGRFKKGHKHSPEARERIKLGRKNGKKPNRIYLPMSEETKQKIREKRKLQVMIPWSKESREKQSKSKTGVIFSDEHRRKIGLASKNRVVSEETRKKISDSHKGEKSYLWKGGITEEHQQVRVSREYKSWRTSCFKRDNWRCQLSGNKGYVVVHHLENFADNPELRFDINNGITLSIDIHLLFHSIYGSKNNTKEQFEEFKKDYLDNKYKNHLSRRAKAKKKLEEKNIDNYVFTDNTNISGGTIENIGQEITGPCESTEISS